MSTTPPKPSPSRRRDPKPDWLKVRAPGGARYNAIKHKMRDLDLHTVCEEAQCPNIGECWSGGTATFMILGDVCTRGCRFCAVSSGKPVTIDWAEPARVANAVDHMGLDYVVLTSVNRDELEDGGSEIFGRTVKAIHHRRPNTLVEVLTPDFQGRMECVHRVVSAEPDVFAHNVETVERLQRTLRDARASWKQSLDVLEYAKTHTIRPHGLTKTSIMVGVGETPEEVDDAMRALRNVGCDVITFGQYLRPSPKHHRVVEYVTPKQFEEYHDRALELGFIYCASGPLVRSSYRAGEYFLKNYFEKRQAS
ncbi:MAG: lipoyl synthase [Myxococcota bacterium]|nr:lipoyl synthase [Myxococcota bacterium]